MAMTSESITDCPQPETPIRERAWTEGQMTDMHREGFEKGMRTGHLETDARNRCKDDIGRYVSDRIQARWEGWQSALRYRDEQEKQA